jgi:hypothetical protein
VYILSFSRSVYPFESKFRPRRLRDASGLLQGDESYGLSRWKMWALFAADRNTPLFCILIQRYYYDLTYIYIYIITLARVCIVSSALHAETIRSLRSHSYCG